MAKDKISERWRKKMRLIARSREVTVNLRFDQMERTGDVITIYKKPAGAVAATEFVGQFDLAVMDYLYVTEERTRAVHYGDGRMTARGSSVRVTAICADLKTMTRRMMMDKVLFSSATDMWATPIDLFNQLDREFKFTIDVCATEDNAKCNKYYTPEQDGLKQEWNGMERCGAILHMEEE